MSMCGKQRSYGNADRVEYAMSGAGSQNGNPELKLYRAEILCQ
jgi:hypothetical protein